MLVTNNKHRHSLKRRRGRMRIISVKNPGAVVLNQTSHVPVPIVTFV